MVEERHVAKQRGVPSPIFPTMEDTHKSYNGNLTHALENMNKDLDTIVVATHNVDSCEIGKKLIEEHSIPRERIIFGQLKAFSDSLTFGLADDGYTVCKYLPYGPTEYLIPYLMRRSQESK